MQVKEVFFVKRKLIAPDGTVLYEPPVPLCSETIVVAGDMGIIRYSDMGYHSYYKDMDTYLKSRFEYVVDDLKTDIMMIDLGDI
jgi:hypothetical protein